VGQKKHGNQEGQRTSSSTKTIVSTPTGPEGGGAFQKTQNKRETKESRGSKNSVLLDEKTKKREPPDHTTKVPEGR